ncbi:MAG: MerR family transcriptional regulator [Chloroflexota bacterium]
MYTIKQAAARIGVSVPTLRAWERRYGVVRPSRTTAGYRLYDDEAIARLVAMHHLVDAEGWRPSQAAERVLAATDLAPLSPPASPPQSAPDEATSRPSEESTREVAVFLAAATDLDVPAMERVLDESFAAQRFELAMDRVVFPAMRAIGDAWSAGEIDVGLEHAASETVRRRLARFFDAAGRGERVPAVIVGLPPGCQHELGAFSFAVAGRRAGLDVLYLGANVPEESWLRTVRETGATVVVLAVVTPADVESATLVVEALRAMARPPRCLLGGASARDVTEAPGVDRLPEALDDAVAIAVETLHAAGRRRR